MSLTDHDAQFRSQLLSLYQDRTLTEESFVNQLANIINEHISSALVKISPAQTVSVPSEGFEITGGLE